MPKYRFDILSVRQTRGGTPWAGRRSARAHAEAGSADPRRAVALSPRLAGVFQCSGSCRGRGPRGGMGDQLPDAYKEFLRLSGGVTAMDVYNGYQLLSVSLLRRIRGESETPRTVGASAVLPVGADGGGNLFLLSLRSPFTVWKWNHEVGAADGGRLAENHEALSVVCSGFSEFLFGLSRTEHFVQVTKAGITWRAERSDGAAEQGDEADEALGGAVVLGLQGLWAGAASCPRRPGWTRAPLRSLSPVFDGPMRREGGYSWFRGEVVDEGSVLQGRRRATLWLDRDASRAEAFRGANHGLGPWPPHDLAHFVVE